MIGHSGIRPPVHFAAISFITPLETTQVGDLAANLGEVLHGERMDFRAGKGVSINQPQQDTQLIEAETEFAARTKVNRFRWSGLKMRYPPALRFGDGMTPIRS